MINVAKASMDISQYLTAGMHHSTLEAQNKIREIILKSFVENFKNHTPQEFCIEINKLNRANDYSI